MSEASTFFKDYMNAVVLRGSNVRFPYTLNEIRSSLEFDKGQMHILIELED